MSATEYLQETKAIKTTCRQQVEISDPRATSLFYYLSILKRTLLPFHPYKAFQHSTESSYKIMRRKSTKKTLTKSLSTIKTRFHGTISVITSFTLFPYPCTQKNPKQIEHRNRKSSSWVRTSLSLPEQISLLTWMNYNAFNHTRGLVQLRCPLYFTTIFTLFNVLSYFHYPLHDCAHHLLQYSEEFSVKYYFHKRTFCEVHE